MSGLLRRWFNVLRGKAESVTEEIESADLCAVLKVSLEDEKKNLQEAERALNQVGGQVKSLEQDVQSLERSVNDWGHNAETALGKGDETLAKKALERQASVEGELKAKKNALVSIKASYSKLTDDILARQGKVRDVESRLTTLRAQEKAADITLKARETVGAHAGDGNALNQISVFEDKVREKVNVATAAGEFDAKASGADVDKEFTDMNRKTAVDDRLAALKAKMAEKAATK